MSTERKLLALIDGHALAFRAFHALRDANLRTSQGEPTYAIVGFLNILLSMLQSHQPTYIAVAFDVGRTFRDDLYAEYKAGRAETPAEFEQQLANIKRVIHALNFPIFEADGYEADDVIGTLARQATERGVNTMILTGDTDTLQLVDEHVQVLLANPYGQKTTTTLYGLQEVSERYNGLKPSQLADLRGLKGDASDNIPGVTGIGEKGALNLLHEFGSVEQLYDRLDAAPKRYRTKLEGQRAQALFSKKLSIIVCDVPISLDLEQSRISDYDRSAVISLFHELEFGNSMVQKLPTVVESAVVAALPTSAATTPEPADGTLQLSMFASEATPTAVAAPSTSNASGDYRGVTTEDELQQLLNELNAAPAFAFDIESTGTTPLLDKIVGLSLAVRPGIAWYIPCAHATGTQLSRQTVLDALRPYFTDAGKEKYAHNAKFDIELLHQAGVTVRGVTFDTSLAARLLNKRVGLKELAFYELQLSDPPTDIKELIGSGKKQITFDQVSIEQAIPYAASDADLTLRLKHALAQELATPENAHIQRIFYELEMPLMPIIIAMEEAGIGIDLAYMRELHDRLSKRIGELEQAIYAIAGEEFNINSGAQLSIVLFDKLNLPTTGLSKTSTGRYSLTADALDRLAASLTEAEDADPEKQRILQLILQYRQLTKLRSTYVDALPDLVNPQTGRIHTSFNQLGASTGRLSSTNPNLQNIPVRTEEGGEIRRAFVAAPGHCFLAADYSQIELRVLAHITQDPALLAVFQNRQDIHSATAAQLFGIAPADVTKNQRRVAKTIIFGVIYGISSFGLAQRTDLSRSEAQAMINALFARFPGIRTYIDETLERGRQEGYVASLFGRRRWTPELKSRGPRRQAAEREAINAPIQSTAADITKLAMLNVAQALEHHHLQTRLLLQVHDELIFEVPHQEVDTVCELVQTTMECVMDGIEPPFQVPLQVNVATGSNWEEMG